MSYVCSKCKAIGNIKPFHYSYLEDDYYDFNWLCDNCIDDYKKEYISKFIMVNIESIIHPYKATLDNIELFKDAVSIYATHTKLDTEDSTELYIFNKTTNFLNNLNGSFIYCKYGATKDGLYGISTIGYISKIK